MVRGGLFNDVDAVLHWHPSDVNFGGVDKALSNKSAKFRFHGISAHASGAPEKGRSALDGVEAMNMMANMMREHIPSDARMHYVITSGGSAPNVVPDFAEVYYYVRHMDATTVESIFDRLVKVSEGAALGTGTTVDHEIIGGTHNLLANDALARVMNEKLNEVGGFGYSPEEQAFAAKIYASLDSPSVPLDSHRGRAGLRLRAAGPRLDRRRRRELDRADRGPPDRDLGAGHPRAQLAGDGGRRHEHRLQRHECRFANSRAHGQGAVPAP